MIPREALRLTNHDALAVVTWLLCDWATPNRLLPAFTLFFRPFRGTELPDSIVPLAPCTLARHSRRIEMGNLTCYCYCHYRICRNLRLNCKFARTQSNLCMCVATIKAISLPLFSRCLDIPWLWPCSPFWQAHWYFICVHPSPTFFSKVLWQFESSFPARHLCYT